MQALQIFDRKKTSLSTEVKDEVRAIANMHNMYMLGVIRGRDISRAVIKKKPQEIVKLQETIAALEADIQVLRECIGSKRDRTSPPHTDYDGP